MDADQLSTRVELRDLVDGYARAADRRDRVAFEALFAPDATLTVHRPGHPPHTYRGPAEIGEIVPRLDHYARTFHLVGNVWCTVSRDRGTGEAYCQAHHVRPRTDDAGPVDLILQIRYLDAYVRVGGAWRFASRDVQILWTAEQAVLEGPLGP
jgi:ketosteroid isomerase-like protein